jgi:hypothetical protein
VAEDRANLTRVVGQKGSERTLGFKKGGTSMADDDAGTGGSVRCKIGGSTTTVDSPQTCSELGGDVVKPPKPDKGTSCRKAVGPAARGFGLVDHDIASVAETFMDDVLKASPSGRGFLRALTSIDRYVMEAVRKDPSLMGEVVLAWTTCIAFLEAPDRPNRKAPQFSRSAYRRLSRLGVRLRKSSDDAKFHHSLDLLKAEFGSWVNKSPDQIRTRYRSKAE